MQANRVVGLMDGFKSFLKTDPPARLSVLLNSAQFYPCAHCGKKDKTVVAAHCNELALGRGFAHKTPDFLIAYLCGICHDVVDGRNGGLLLEQKRAMWNRAYVVTMSWLWRDGLLKVA